MLLVIDVGNTNVVMGVFDGDKLVGDWRIHTDSAMTEDEFAVFALNMFSRIHLDPSRLGKTVISSVVPPMTRLLDAFCRKYVGHEPHWVDSRSIMDRMPILYANPASVGADRIVNAYAAYSRYKTSLIVIDFGTATTFDAVSEKGEYLGGAISPGINISAEALYARASKLPRVELFTPPEKAIGKDTTGSIQSGIIFGYAGLVDGMVLRMKKEMATIPKVIATGGLSRLMYKVSETIESIEPDLTLEGLRLIAENF
jgi:type III pantothenate kinase